MVELQHGHEPRELKEYRRKRTGGGWENPKFKPLRMTVRHSLNQDQGGLCVYCEDLLDKDGGHIDHIKPRSLEPKVMFSYTNMAHSCDGPGHCGKEKRSRILPIEPGPGCNRFFTLVALDGRVEPAPDLSAADERRAVETRDILGLNAPRLSWRRRGFVAAVRAFSDPAERDDFIASGPFRWLLSGL